MINLKKIITIILTASLMCVPVKAQETETSAPFDGYIVKLKAGQTLMTLMDNDEESTLDPVKYVNNTYTTNDLSTIESLEAIGAVDYYEPNYIAELYDYPNDPYYTNSAENQWSLDMLSLSYAWENDISGDSVTVCILDSGVYAEHEDFYGTDLSRGHNFITNSTDLGDSLGHGTFVTSIIAAATNNGIGISGIAPNVNIVTLKCFEAKNGGTYSSIASALAKAVAPIDEGGYDCDIINMSFGGSANSATLSGAINAASQAGAILIASVGNDSGSALRYPAAYDCVIGVGAVDKDLNIGSFSNYNSSVDVVAPGVAVCGIATTAGQYLVGSGTSFSAPCVTAVAALAKSVCPNMTSDRFISLLQSTSTDLGDTGRDDEYGYGLLNTNLILRELREDAGLSARIEDNKLCVTGCFFEFSAGSECLFVAAGYDSAGRIKGIDSFRSQADESGRVLVHNWISSLSMTGSSVTVFALDSNNIPMCEKLKVSVTG